MFFLCLKCLDIPLRSGADLLLSSLYTSHILCDHINGLAQVLFEGVFVEAYKLTRRKHNIKFRQIGHTTSQYGQSFFPKTITAWNGLAFAEAPSLAVFRSNFIKN